jgi:M6 family metalloprotease-like protein
VTGFWHGRFAGGRSGNLEIEIRAAGPALSLEGASVDMDGEHRALAGTATQSRRKLAGSADLVADAGAETFSVQGMVRAAGSKLLLKLRRPGGPRINAVLARGRFAQPTCVLDPGSNRHLTEGPTDRSVHPDPFGTLRAVMIFVDFPDAPWTEPASGVFAVLVPAAQGWLDEVSYGDLALDVTPVNAWYRMPAASAGYGLADGATFEEHRAYVADAVAAADADVDFSGFDLVYVVASNGAALPASPAFLAPPGGGVPADGAEVRLAVTFGADIRTPIPGYGSRVLVHETGHLLGLPDLYAFRSPTFEQTFRFAGGWDTMSWLQPGAHFLAWHKWKLGWLDGSQVVCAPFGRTEAYLTPLGEPGGLKAVVAQVSASRAYVVELRRAAGEDARLCEEGLLVYTVDAAVPSGSGPVVVRGAGAGAAPAQVAACGPLYDAPFALGAGETPRFVSEADGVRVEVAAESGTDVLVRVTRR